MISFVVTKQKNCVMLLLLIALPVLAGLLVWLLGRSSGPAPRIDCAKQDCLECPIAPNCKHYLKQMGIDD